MLRFIPNRVKHAVQKLLGKLIPPPPARDKVYTNRKSYIFSNTPTAGKLAGRVAVVSGGYGAIGRAICACLLAEGAMVFVGGRSKEKTTAVAAELSAAAHSDKVQPLLFWITDEDSVSAAIAQVVNSCGRLDIWVNCAGGSARENAKPIHMQSMNIIDEVMTSNLRSCIIGSKLAATQMIAQGYGRIINFGSVIGIGGKANYTDYAASKGGVVAFSRSLAQELGQYGITVNIVSPGGIPRDTFDDNHLEWCMRRNVLQRVGSCEDAAWAVAFLASDEAAYITGVELAVDGGRTLGLRGDT